MNEEILKMEVKNAARAALTDADKNKILIYKQQLDGVIRDVGAMILDAKFDDEKLKTMTAAEAQRYKLRLATHKVDMLKSGTRNFLQKLTDEKIIPRAAAERLLALYNSSGGAALNESRENLLKNIMTALKGTRELLDKKA